MIKWMNQRQKINKLEIPDLLNLHVASVQDGDSQFEGAGHHRTQTTWGTEREAETQATESER